MVESQDTVREKKALVSGKNRSKIDRSTGGGKTEIETKGKGVCGPSSAERCIAEDSDTRRCM